MEPNQGYALKPVTNAQMARFYPVEVHMQFFSQPRGGYYLAFIQDITSRKKIEERFRQNTEELRKAQ